MAFLDLAFPDGALGLRMPSVPSAARGSIVPRAAVRRGRALDAAERKAVLLSRRDRSFVALRGLGRGVAAIAKRMTFGTPPVDPELEALHRFAEAVVRGGPRRIAETRDVLRRLGFDDFRIDLASAVAFRHRSPRAVLPWSHLLLTVLSASSVLAAAARVSDAPDSLSAALIAALVFWLAGAPRPAPSPRARAVDSRVSVSI